MSDQYSTIPYDDLGVIFNGTRPMLTQVQMAKLFGISRDAVSHALKRAEDRGSIDLESEYIELKIVAEDGKRHLVKHYSFKAVIVVGIRVNEISLAVLDFFDWVQRVIEAMATRAEYPIAVRRRHRVSAKGYIYLLKSEHGYKIGRTKNLKRRANTFSLRLPFDVEMIHAFHCEDYTTMEQNLHQRFADKHINGEWFTLDPEDVAYICSLGE